MQKRWETPTKFYQVDLHQDLLNAWVVMKTWGSRTSKSGACAVDIVESYSAGLAAIQETEKRRIKHGYHTVSTQWTNSASL